MLYEAVITYPIIDQRGNDKVAKERYIVDGLDMFSEVEARLYDEFCEHNDLDVIAIKRSSLREITNEAPAGDHECKIFFATIVDHYITENGDDKELKYTVGLFAHDIQEAHNAAKQYISQGLEDMELKQLKETKFLDVIE